MSNNRSVWRFIPFLEASGGLQMAIDAWLLEQHSQGKHPPTLRFYTWKPATISLGYHQRSWPEFWQNLTWQGQPVELVRRPSGGRAVLHQGDLTYAVVTSRLPKRRLEAYQTVCKFLIEGWGQLGFPLVYGSAGRGYIHNPNCFETATGADLILPDGSKLIGSAQLRRDNAILQHGSMRLEPDIELHRRVFGINSVPSIVQRFNSVDSDSDVKNLVITALVRAACECFNIDLQTQPLLNHEWQAIQANLPKFSVS